MIEYIRYGKKKCRKLRLHIDPHADFSAILKTLNQMDFITTPINSEQIMYAILELLNNSLRAQKEKGVSKPILTQFSINNNSLHIKVQDWGGGFDLNQLPYDLYCNVEEINTNNENFQEYREKHGYIRFGIGLYVVRKTFHRFNLFFIDEDLMPVEYDSGKAKGTCIELSLEDKTHE
jgi:sensor histidine kinase regulating citrate/malate metabolism